MTTILFLAANPIDTEPLRVDEEMREIKQRIRSSQFGSLFRIEQEWAVRTTDVIEHLRKCKPEIVHFSGHGNEAGEMLLEDSDGRSAPVGPEKLRKLFERLKHNVQGVVLNGCYSRVQAEAIAKSIDFVVGMSTAISDRAAILFSGTFYQTLADGGNVQEAYDSGCLQIELDASGEEEIPEIVFRAGVSGTSVFVLEKQQEPTPPSSVPKFLAEFTKNRQGKLLRHGNHYEIRLYIRNAPTNTQRVIYDLHKSYSEPRRQVQEGEPDFQEYIYSYGDYKVGVRIVGEHQSKFSRWLSSALEEHYGDNPTEEISRAIDEIIAN
jgi:hypothetical protein